jgi:hypothetical protein
VTLETRLVVRASCGAAGWQPVAEVPAG